LYVTEPKVALYHWVLHPVYPKLGTQIFVIDRKLQTR
jgi:hypothetical protein